MSIRFNSFMTIALMSAVSVLGVSNVSAQTETPIPTPQQNIPTESIPEVFERGFYHGLGTAIDQATIGGQLNNYFGWRNFPEGSYPENQIARELDILTTLYKDVMKQQTQNDPLMRTRDLANPFNTSVRQNPNYIRPIAPTIEREAIIEDLQFTP